MRISLVSLFNVEFSYFSLENDPQEVQVIGRQKNDSPGMTLQEELSLNQNTFH